MLLTTARLILREFVAEDWPAVLAYQSDPRYLRYYHWTGRTPVEVQDFVGMFLAQQQVEPRLKTAACGDSQGYGRIDRELWASPGYSRRHPRRYGL